MMATIEVEASNSTQLVRSQSDLGPRLEQAKANGNARGNDRKKDWIRHGWYDQMNSEEYLSALTSVSLRIFSESEMED